MLCSCSCYCYCCYFAIVIDIVVIVVMLLLLLLLLLYNNNNNDQTSWDAVGSSRSDHRYHAIYCTGTTDYRIKDTQAGRRPRVRLPIMEALRAGISCYELLLVEISGNDRKLLETV